ncbi:hypothetical protein [Endothiovibrio diazotrophicus]
MASQHSGQEIDLYQPVRQEEERESVPESVGTEGTVVPFDAGITIAKTRLERLIDRIAEDSDVLQGRVAGMEPRQEAVEQRVSEEAEALSGLAAEVRHKLERLESGQEQLAEGSAEELARVGETLALLDERVAALEPTPQKLELVAAKLARVDERLGVWTAQLEERLDALADGQELLEERTSGLAGGLERLRGWLGEVAKGQRANGEEIDRLLRSTDILSELGERLERRVERRTVIGGAALVALLLLVAAAAFFGYYRIDRQGVEVTARVEGVAQGLNQGLAHVATAQGERIDAVNDTLSGSVEGLEQRFAATSEELAQLQARLDVGLNPQYDPTSNAITIPLHDEDWLLARDPAHFTVELLVAGNKGELFDFVRYFQPRLTQAVAYTPVKQRGREWYLLAYGDFATPAEARATVEALPAAVQRYRPRVHRIAELQRMMGE